jgi:hypothetical protein
VAPLGESGQGFRLLRQRGALNLLRPGAVLQGNKVYPVPCAVSLSDSRIKRAEGTDDSNLTSPIAFTCSGSSRRARYIDERLLGSAHFDRLPR